MKHALTEQDVIEANSVVLAKILSDLGLTRIKGTTDTEVKHGLLLKHIGEGVELNHRTKCGDSVPMPGDRVENSFALLDWTGRAVESKVIEGVFVGVWNGYCHVRYKTADLPARFHTADVMPEFTDVPHETDPDGIIEFVAPRG